MKRVIAILFLVSALTAKSTTLDFTSERPSADSDTTAIVGSGIGSYWSQLKPSLPGIATSVAFSSLIRWGIVGLMKNNIHEMRPDRSGNSSMPSRHAVWGYGLATTATNYLINFSSFWGIGAHAVAAGIGFERVINHKHYAGDVLAGAGIGIASSLISDCISRLIFSTPTRYTFPDVINQRLFISFSTGASFPLRNDYGDFTIGTALSSQLQFAAKVDDPWLVGCSIFMQAAPLKQDSQYLGTLSHIGFSAGGAYNRPIADTPLDFTSSAGVGISYAFAPGHIDVRRFSPYAEIATGINLHLTESFSLGAQAGYSLSSLALSAEGQPHKVHALSSIHCSLITIAHF